MSDQNRIENLEVALAHQEQQIQDMSEMINAQWTEIERLKRHITKTEGKLLEFIEADKNTDGLSPTDFAAQNKPPHY